MASAVTTNVKDLKPKDRCLFISSNLFKNDKLKRRISAEAKKLEEARKPPKAKEKETINGVGQKQNSSHRDKRNISKTDEDNDAMKRQLSLNCSVLLKRSPLPKIAVADKRKSLIQTTLKSNVKIKLKRITESFIKENSKPSAPVKGSGEPARKNSKGDRTL